MSKADWRKKKQYNHSSQCFCLGLRKSLEAAGIDDSTYRIDVHPKPYTADERDKMVIEMTIGVSEMLPKVVAAYFEKTGDEVTITKAAPFTPLFGSRAKAIQITFHELFWNRVYYRLHNNLQSDFGWQYVRSLCLCDDPIQDALDRLAECENDEYERARIGDHRRYMFHSFITAYTQYLIADLPLDDQDVRLEYIRRCYIATGGDPNVLDHQLLQYWYK